MPSPSGEYLSDPEHVVHELNNQTVGLLHQFGRLKELYYASELRIELLNTVAKCFFGELFYVLMGQVVVDVCKLTDRKEMAGRQNFTIEHVHQMCTKDSRYPVAQGAELVKSVEDCSEPLRTWRNRITSHNDLQAIQEPAQFEVVPGDIQDSLDALCRYTDLVNETVGDGPCDLHVPDFFGVPELVGALKDSVALRAELEVDPMRVDAILRKSRFNVA